MPNDLRIIFMGTPEFAVPSLEILIANGCNVVAVVTVPDKPTGRGLQVSASPVKVCAEAHNIPVLQPEKLKNPEFIEELRSYNADVQVVVAFRMLPEIVWTMPPKGTFNLHSSLLPQYRGAAPINWAIINGETETGVTTFFLQHEIDTGDIIFQEKEAILPSDNVGTLYEKLMNRGAKLVHKTIEMIAAGHVPTQPQTFGEDLKSAPKIFKETCRINFNKTAHEVHNFVRGLSPYPAAFTTIGEKSCKIFRTSVVNETSDLPVGTLASDHKKYLHIATAKGLIAIEEIQMEGKKRMGIEDFLRGNKLSI